MAYTGSRGAHDTMMRSTLELLLQEGCENIRAGCGEHARPAAITCNGRKVRPDITAEYQRIPLICDVETNASITSPKTGEKFQLLSEHARETGACFLVVVPRGFGRETRKQLATLQATVENIWEI